MEFNNLLSSISSQNNNQFNRQNSSNIKKFNRQQSLQVLNESVTSECSKVINLIHTFKE